MQVNYNQEAKKLERLYRGTSRATPLPVILRLVRQRGPEGARKFIEETLLAPPAPYTHSATESRPAFMSSPSKGPLESQADPSHK